MDLTSTGDPVAHRRTVADRRDTRRKWQGSTLRRPCPKESGRRGPRGMMGCRRRARWGMQHAGRHEWGHWGRRSRGIARCFSPVVRVWAASSSYFPHWSCHRQARGVRCRGGRTRSDGWRIVTAGRHLPALAIGSQSFSCGGDGHRRAGTQGLGRRAHGSARAQRRGSPGRHEVRGVTN